MYKVNNQTTRSNFNKQAQYSRSFYGKYSLAGNPQLAATATESYQVDYHYSNYYADLGKSHQHVVATFAKMVKDINFVDKSTKKDRVLDIKDLDVNHTNEWSKIMGLNNQDSGEIDGIKPDGIKTMEVNIGRSGIKQTKIYEKN